MSEVTIDLAEGPEDMAHVRALFVEYAEWLGFSLCFQGFDRELAALPGDYAPPRGRLFLARVDGAVAGTVGLRPLDADACEMKRLFVRPAYRGHGLGRRLAETVVAAGRDLGYAAMRLDTVPKLREAIDLYRAMGFVEVPDYHPATADGAPDGLMFFEKRYRSE